MEPAASRRDENKRRTRAALHAAAVRLVAERGLEDVRADEIADAAGVSARTFFNYFPTKDAAVAGTNLEAGKALAARFRALPPEADTWQALATLFTQHILDLADDAELWRRRREIFRRYPHLMSAAFGQNQQIERELVAALAESRELSDPSLVAALAMRTVGVAIGAHIEDATPGAIDPDGLARRIEAAFAFARPAGLH